MLHHVLFSTVIFNSINCEPAIVPLTERWMCLPEECVPLRLISIHIGMWSRCYKRNRQSNPSEDTQQTQCVVPHLSTCLTYSVLVCHHAPSQFSVHSREILSWNHWCYDFFNRRQPFLTRNQSCQSTISAFTIMVIRKNLVIYDAFPKHRNNLSSIWLQNFETTTNGYHTHMNHSSCLPGCVSTAKCKT